jgi:hypothetical protein
MDITTTQKKKPISKEFWNRMKWIKWRTSSGLPNQKCSLDGFNLRARPLCVSFDNDAAASWANPVIMCSSLAPTISRSCNSHPYLRIVLTVIKLVLFWIRIKKKDQISNSTNTKPRKCFILTKRGRKASQKYVCHPAFRNKPKHNRCTESQWTLQEHWYWYMLIDTEQQILSADK